MSNTYATTNKDRDTIVGLADEGREALDRAVGALVDLRESLANRGTATATPGELIEKTLRAIGFARGDLHAIRVEAAEGGAK